MRIERETGREASMTFQLQLLLFHRETELTPSIIEFLNQLPWIMPLRFKGPRSRFTSSVSRSLSSPPLRRSSFPSLSAHLRLEMPQVPLAIPNHTKSLTSVFVTVTRALSQALGGSSSMSCCDQYFSRGLRLSAWESVPASRASISPDGWELRGPWRTGDAGEVIFRQITMVHLQIGLWMRANQAERQREMESDRK